MIITLKRVNPYLKMGELHTKGLDAFINNITPNTLVITEIPEQIGIYIDSIEVSDDNRYQSNLINTQGVSSVALNRFEDAIDTEDFEANSLKELLDTPISTSYQQVKEFLHDVESRSYTCGLSSAEERLMLMATAIGDASADYWKQQIDDGDASPWSDFLGANFLSSWTQAAVRGTILFGMNSGVMPTLSASITFSTFEAVKDSL